MSRRNLAWAGQDGLNFQSGEHGQFVERVHVEGIADGHHEPTVVAAERHQRAAVNQLERHGQQGFRLDFDIGEIDQFQVEFLGKGGEDVFFFREVAFDDQLVQRLGRNLSVSLGDTSDIVGLENTTADETLRELHAGLGSEMAVSSE